MLKTIVSTTVLLNLSGTDAVRPSCSTCGSRKKKSDNSIFSIDWKKHKAPRRFRGLLASHPDDDKDLSADELMERLRKVGYGKDKIHSSNPIAITSKHHPYPFYVWEDESKLENFITNQIAKKLKEEVSKTTAQTVTQTETSGSSSSGSSSTNCPYHQVKDAAAKLMAPSQDPASNMQRTKSK